MKEKGFIPIIIIVTVLVISAATGGAYYSGIIPGVKPHQELPLDINTTTKEATPANQPSFKDQQATSSSSNEQSSPRLRSSMDILRSRSSQKTPTPLPTPLLPVTPKPSLTPSPIPSHTIVPSPTPIPTPNCNINIASKNSTITTNTSGASLSVSPATGVYKAGENIAVQINFNPNGHTNIDAIDAILLFDSAKITATSIEEKISQVNYPSKLIDNSSGKIILSLMDYYYTGKLNGSSALAVINFKINSSANNTTEVKFNLDVNNPSSGTDSNVIERNNMTDVLGSVTNSLYTIKPAGCN